jgi:hypothetical protein
MKQAVEKIMQNGIKTVIHRHYKVNESINVHEVINKP